MQLSFNSDQVDLLKSKNVQSPYINGRIQSMERFSSKSMDIELNRVERDQLDSLLKSLKECGKELQNHYNVAKVIIDLIKNPTTSKVGSLRNLAEALNMAFETLPNRFLFKKDRDGITSAYYAGKASYTEARGDNPAHVSFQTQWYSRGSNQSQTVNFFSSDVKSGANVWDILSAEGYLPESEDLMEVYNRNLGTYQDLLLNHGQQYVTSKYYGGDRYIENLVTSTDKVVNNYNEVDIKTPKDPNENFKIAIHPLIAVFVLEKHINTWAHVEHLSVYKYNPKIKEKLVLHPDHEDLIDALAETYMIEMADVIEGKSGGTIVLAEGTAGVGKTLTAEVLSEVIEHPLYKINVSLLGTNPVDIEKRLKTAMARANSWGAILLLDEADLYIMERDSNIEHNAIVTIFLRSLEYSHGLTFLTTNKGKNVDDAVLSRCTAIINYDLPEESARKRLWQILTKQFEINADETLINELTSAFPKASGRDIKMLCILVYKYCKAKSLAPDLKLFKRMSVFRGMESA